MSHTALSNNLFIKLFNEVILSVHGVTQQKEERGVIQ